MTEVGRIVQLTRSEAPIGLPRIDGQLTLDGHAVDPHRLLAEHRRMREALIRLRDCDWVITPGDRMDAVRRIAREGLGG